ncbi:MAG: hypothetical protein AB7N80_04185 [Bdellovibrionales bacterium]
MKIALSFLLWSCTSFADIDQLLSNPDLRLSSGQPKVVYNPDAYSWDQSPNGNRQQVWSKNSLYVIEMETNRQKPAHVTELRRDVTQVILKMKDPKTPVFGQSFQIADGRVKSATGCNLTKAVAARSEELPLKKTESQPVDAQDMECWSVTEDDCDQLSKMNIPLNDLGSTPELYADQVADGATLATCVAFMDRVNKSQIKLFDRIEKNKSFGEQKKAAATIKRIYEERMAMGRPQIREEELVLNTASFGDARDMLKIYGQIVNACGHMRGYKFPKLEDMPALRIPIRPPPATGGRSGSAS